MTSVTMENFFPSNTALKVKRYEGFFPDSGLEDSRSNSPFQKSDGSDTEDIVFEDESTFSPSTSPDLRASEKAGNLNCFKSITSLPVCLGTPEYKEVKKIAISKRHTPRKPLKPIRSATRNDPNFRGVTIQFKNSVKKGQTVGLDSQLIISSYFSCKKRRRAEFIQQELPVRKLSPKSLFRSHADQFSSDENDLGVKPLCMEKECASCGTYKTPLWRDAEDGTPLCNACGIRYKKYRIHCLRCWYIPKKEEKALPKCTSCGQAFKYTFSRRLNSFSDFLA